MTNNPFGKYATVISAVAAVLILGAWLVSTLHAFGIAQNPTLDSLALVVIGVVFGTGAGAQVVANGAAKSADAANVRLDAIAAPSAPVATNIVTNGLPPAEPTTPVTPPQP